MRTRVHRTSKRCDANFRASTQHNIEPTHRGPHRRAHDRRKRNNHRVPFLLVTDSTQHPVLCVLRFTLEIGLRREVLTSGGSYLEVNVPRAARIQTGLDGSEPILTIGGGLETSVSLKVQITPGVSIASRLDVSA